jgi:hypothetical protein
MWYKISGLTALAYIGLMAVYYQSMALSVAFVGAMACFILALLIEDQYRN